MFSLAEATFKYPLFSLVITLKRFMSFIQYLGFDDESPLRSILRGTDCNLISNVRDSVSAVKLFKIVSLLSGNVAEKLEYSVETHSGKYGLYVEFVED